MLPPPPPGEHSRSAQLRAAAGERHALLAEVRSHEGVLAANVRVELWRHTNAGEIVLERTAQTDREGVAELPFSGRGVYCVHAVHPEIGTAELPTAHYQLIGDPQRFPIALILPESEVRVYRSGIAQIGMSMPDGRPLALARVAAKHDDFGNGSLDYSGFTPRASREDERTEALAEAPGEADDREWIVCDAHLQLGGVAAEGLAVPFHEFALGGGTELEVTEFPVCCRSWSRRAVAETSLDEFLRIAASSGLQNLDAVAQVLRDDGFRNVSIVQDQLFSNTRSAHEHTAAETARLLLLFPEYDSNQDAQAVRADSER